jgi:hypothetical protein
LIFAYAFIARKLQNLQKLIAPIDDYKKYNEPQVRWAVPREIGFSRPFSMTPIAVNPGDNPLAQPGGRP